MVIKGGYGTYAKADFEMKRNAALFLEMCEPLITNLRPLGLRLVCGLHIGKCDRKNCAKFCGVCESVFKIRNKTFCCIWTSMKF